MRRIGIVHLLFFAIQVCADESAKHTGDVLDSHDHVRRKSTYALTDEVYTSFDKLRGTVCQKLLQRAFGLGHTEMDESTFGKPGHLAIHASRSLAPLRVLGSPDSRQFRSKREPRSMKVSVYGIFHHDLVTLPANVDSINRAVSIIHNLPTNWLAWYDDRVLEFPLVTKSMTSGFCFSVGDLCAQGVAGKNLSTLDLQRSARSGAAGVIYQGPAMHYWLDFLDKSLSFGGAWWAALPKVAIDIGPMAIVDNTIYSLILGAFAFKDPKEVLRDVQATWQPGIIESMRFWPAVKLMEFSVIPVQFQLLFEDVASIVWVCILSGVNHDEIQHIGMEGDKNPSPYHASAPADSSSMDPSPVLSVSPHLVRENSAPSYSFAFSKATFPSDFAYTPAKDIIPVIPSHLALKTLRRGRHH